MGEAYDCPLREKDSVNRTAFASIEWHTATSIVAPTNRIEIGLTYVLLSQALKVEHSATTTAALAMTRKAERRVTES